MGDLIYLRFTDRVSFGAFCVALRTSEIAFGIMAEMMVVLCRTAFDNLPDGPKGIFALSLDRETVSEAPPPSREVVPLTGEEVAAFLRELAARYSASE